MTRNRRKKDDPHKNASDLAQVQNQVLIRLNAFEFKNGLLTLRGVPHQHSDLLLHVLAMGMFSCSPCSGECRSAPFNRLKQVYLQKPLVYIHRFALHQCHTSCGTTPSHPDLIAKGNAPFH